MGDKLNESKNYKLRFDREAMPYRVFATWNIHYACNYRCAYCHAPKPGHKDARNARYLSSDIWIDIWKRIYERYGTWEMLISGGEPFTYPGFMELIIELSRIHLIGVCTNLEWDVSHFVKFADPQRVRIEASFHPEFANLEKFVDKLILLKENGISPTVNFVPWPPLLDKMQRIKEEIEGAGFQLTLQPFIGQFENRSYPQGYTREEKELLGIFKDDCNIKTLDFKTTRESDSTKGRLCRMGQNYAFIYPDGEAFRCCRDQTFSLGNIIDGSFSLLDEPAACQAQNCNCWRCMLVGKEDFWWRHWGRYEITDIAMAQHKKNNGFRISLVQPPVWGTFEPPVALAQLSGCLKRASYNVSVFDLNIELYNARKEQYNTVWAIEQSSFWGESERVKNFFTDNAKLIEGCIDNIVQTKPDMVGFSVNVCSLAATVILADKIKQKIPQVKVVIGGPMFFVSADIASIIEHESIDIIVYGEGEETFSELPRYFTEHRDLSGCRGIYFKKNGEVVKTQPRLPIENLDGLPFLDLKSFSLERYNPPGHLGNHISLMTSRGCVLNCVYCGPKAYWKGFRSMSGRRIYDEVKYHIQNNPLIEHIEFLDLELNGSMKALDEFCDLMIANPPKSGIRWHANIIIRPEIDRSFLFKMKQAGCHRLSVGIESGSQRVLDLMKKRYKVEDAERVLQYAHEAGIHVTTNFMFGFPGETKEDFNLTLEFLRRNAKAIGTVYPSRTFCTIEPFSYLSQHLDEFGIVADPVYNLYWESVDGKNDYPERLRRCEEFSKMAIELEVPIGLGLQTSLELDRYYNLGFYYEYKKDFRKAAGFFKKYLKLDPENTVINRKLQELELIGIGPTGESRIDRNKAGLTEKNTDGLDHPHKNGGISFNWDIHWACNYRCPYCWFYGKWAELKLSNRNLDVKELMSAWQKIYRKYGEVKISITGGEPFLYPDFAEFISELINLHKVEIITNLSTDIRKLIEPINSENLKINPSFHPLFADFDRFLERVIFLKEKGMVQCVSYVAWPPQISKIGYYTDKFQHYAISLSLQSFFGEYGGLRYPDAYTEEQRKIILPQIGQRGGRPFQTEPLKTKGKLCAAGQRYGVIHPDGTVLRCGGIEPCEEASRIGNLFDDGFKLFEQLSPCTSEICPCNEWAFLLVE